MSKTCRNLGVLLRIFFWDEKPRGCRWVALNQSRQTHGGNQYLDSETVPICDLRIQKIAGFVSQTLCKLTLLSQYPYKSDSYPPPKTNNSTMKIGPK